MSNARAIDVKKQRNLTLIETFHLCVKGIAHRLLRSLLTLAVVVLAVAFFMFLLSETSFVSSTERGVRKEVAEERFAATLLDRMYNAPSSSVLSRRLSVASKISPSSLDEYAAVAGWESGRVRQLAQDCAREQACLRFFETIPVGKCIILAGKLKGRAILESLSDAGERAGFVERIKPMPDLDVPEGIKGFSAFMEKYRDYEKQLDAFAADWKKAIEDFAKASNEMTSGMAVDAWLCDATPDQLKAWGNLAASKGFKLEPDRLPVIEKQLRLAATKQKIVHMLSSTEKQELWRKTFLDRKMISTDEKLLRLKNEKMASILDNQFTANQLGEITESVVHENRLTDLEQKLAGKVEATAEAQTLSGRQLFLLIISFVVCMVGIANAMLMSITERFREIATMKCLGATDRYILVQFMLEAALQGVAGGLMGMVIGFLIAVVKNSASYGSYLFAYWPGMGLAGNGAVSLAAGVLLAVLASVYPSLAASRMAPMDAMRIE